MCNRVIDNMSGTFTQLYIQVVFSVKGQENLLSKFSWQEGYGAFSYRHTQIKDFYNYILNQEEHHKKH